MDLILNDRKHLLRTETFQKPFLKAFYQNNKGTRKVKDFQNLSNNKIYFILQSNSTRYYKPFKFISWPNFLERHPNLISKIWGKSFTDWFKKSSDGYIFSNLRIHRMSKIFCVPDVKNPLTLSAILTLVTSPQFYLIATDSKASSILKNQ